ncbi:YEATS domain-containing protein 2 isoform X1 [Falco biarmicus]|uniref:YEATS domain-containing protein 2 isoform X1 n=1 Tax=Falco peregrinus TaxID=8954 RepID=UPI000386FAEE|nr:YEATS domain-containing protein 2 isoform X1 [Falco peregrinus]XP_027635338.1 YEATS domain-containing protein 2 isoform X1 [Falco peregrinus]XP_027664606.1 YEATS domain-containing protein 2 isoform X1 [Falco cherrug]XP_037262291.1 YEATS domain-containing protein 2 isoform X1 [Falco rusticolus]XP_037262292.1 YEATS domain-containing protein 2 isoform X1 [Falco rusticolus]XP_037262293.1 YEATS domain-containing protein 2 isoform X1 [Falco rusticolus]XP_055579380.1 YEATS domain-containing prote
MSGIKRVIAEKDPDYEEITVVHPNKRYKAAEQSARDVAVQKIETIIKEQFAVEMKSKEHEIEVIDQRLIEARRMMDKLRACIVANYYASAGLLKAGEGTRSCDATILNHPSIKKFLESPSRSSSPANQGSDTPSANHSESDSLSQHNDFLLDKDNSNLDADERLTNSLDQRQSRNTGRDSSGVSSSQKPGQRNAGLSNDETSRLYVKKTIVVGNVSKYIPPDKREENDQSTHKWMVYVRGSRREPSINHFVKKVWFFLHPSYKPNDLVEVREPPFHLTRRGWGEFPVRVQIHFKDSQNKRIDIIHNLKLDRTYTGLQTLGAETVVDVELHRHSLGEEYLFSQSSESDLSDVPTSLPLPLSIPAPVKASSPIKQLRDSSPDASVDKGFPGNAETERHATFYSLPSSIERTPTKLATQKVAFGSHGNSAFQPIAASCKIVPQGQSPSPAESPGKSFQPITMSCKIVSGSPISTPSPSPLPRTPTSTPVHMKQGSASSVINNPYVIVDKPGQMVGAAATSTGSPTSKQASVCQASHGTGSPVSKTHGNSFVTSAVKQEDSLFATMPPLCPIGSHSKVQSPKSVTGGLGAFTKVIIKQEPGELPQQPQLPVTGTATQTSVQQYVTVKGSHMLALSPQKPVVSTGEGTVQSKVVGVPVGSALQSTVKQAVAISGGQILVAKSSSSVAKAVGPKQVVTQGVAKAIVSGGGGTIVAQPVQTITKAQVSSTGAQKSTSQGSVMATLQLPATNLANLANLPPGTKLYLTTNSKNPSGKGKLLLIPQGAILRATNNASLQSGSSTNSGGGGAQSTSSNLSQHLTYTSYILKQTPQGTFLVGQPSPQSSGKQLTPASVVQGNVGVGTSSTQGQALKVITGQKTALFTQAAPSGQTSLVKISDGSIKSVPATSQLSKPGTTVLRVSGGVITTAAAPAVALPTNGVAQQIDNAGSSSSSSGTPVAKTSGQQHQICISQSQSTSSVVNKTATSTVVSVASLMTTPTPVTGKAAVSGLLKIHSNQSSPQQAVLTVPSQLKQLGVNTASGGVQTILMPMNKVIQSLSTSKVSAVSTVTAASTIVPSPSTASVTKVKMEPDSTGQNCSSVGTQEGQAAVKTEESSELGNYVINIEYLENIQQLLTAIVKKVPLIAEKSEDASSFCASSVEQYYSWNIGKRRAAEWQRAMTVRKILQEIIEKHPRFHNITPLKTKHVVHWCRCHGYTPPDPETLRNDEDSIEDVLTQIDSEPECPSSYSSGEELCRKLEELQQFLKREPEHEEEVDILNFNEPLKINIKKEQEEKQEEMKFYLASLPASEFVRDAAEKIGISFQPAEVQKNVYASVIEDMILKATEQLMSDILRQALAVAYQTAPHNRTPREITVMNIHKAICNIPFLDFLTNKHMKILNEEQ